MKTNEATFIAMLERATVQKRENKKETKMLSTTEKHCAPSSAPFFSQSKNSRRQNLQPFHYILLNSKYRVPKFISHCQILAFNYRTFRCVTKKKKHLLDAFGHWVVCPCLAVWCGVKCGVMCDVVCMWVRLIFDVLDCEPSLEEAWGKENHPWVSLVGKDQKDDSHDA